MNQVPQQVSLDAPAVKTRPSITVTGADERTDLDSLCSINAEIGILYTNSPDGRNRYPRLDWIKEAGRSIANLSIHICGLRARTALFRGELDDLMAPAGRIQVNGRISEMEIVTLCELFPEKFIITQHCPANQFLPFVTRANHALLVDGSGGRGISPAEWVHPATNQAVGFAGGLGPQNLATELPKILSIARRGAWVDMEGKLRVDDWFSAAMAAEAVAIFHAKMEGSAS